MFFVILIVILAVSLWLMGNSKWHLERNKHNQLPKGSLSLVEDSFYKDEAGLIWEKQPHIKNKFHQPDTVSKKVDNPYPNIIGTLEFDQKNPNLKFLSKAEKGGSFEAIVQPNGTYLTEGVKQGTYNYGHPSGFIGTMTHVFLDVIPHFINSKYRS
ncbi:hypothetical protein OAF63_05510 [Saprospiraceae bacterium]|jgi:hypothetical protein|nr:hypothetical protein [Saprospiraceae bacterium]